MRLNYGQGQRHKFIDDQRETNAAEAVICQGKWRYRLCLIREKRAVNQGSAIAINVFEIYLQKLLKSFVLSPCWLYLLVHNNAGEVTRSAISSHLSWFTSLAITSPLRFSIAQWPMMLRKAPTPVLP